MDGWAITWLVLFVVVLAVELTAVFNTRRGDTLSEKVWFILFRDGRKENGVRWLPWIGLAVFFAWLVPHFLIRWVF